MYYYADLYINTNDKSAQRWNFIIIEKRDKGWAKALLVRIDEVKDGILQTHVIDQYDKDNLNLPIFRARSKIIYGVNTYIMNMPKVERGISVGLIPSNEIIPLTMENVNHIVFYGNGLP